MSLKFKVLGSTALMMLLLGGLARAGALGSFLGDYMPHRFCYSSQPGLIWTNVLMDGLIAASYGLIFIYLFWVAAKLRTIEDIHGYLWIFISFGLFIVACGATHLMEVVTVWWPVYPVSTAVKVVCAAASVPTAILFARAAPVIAANIKAFLDMLSTTQQEKKQALVALLASEKLAVAGRISASIAHEINNPLETVGNVLYMLRHDDRLPLDLQKWIENAASELDRASTIAQNTLSLYRESNVPSALALGPLVQGVLDLQSAEMLKRQIILQSRLQTPLPLTAYSSELRQILINLIQNSAAAIGTDGRIQVRVQLRCLRATNVPGLGGLVDERNGISGYSITVADTGPGIAAQNRQRLFTMFFTTKGEQGTGLGLWLVRSMVEKHGGRIRFRSRTAAETSKPGTLFNVWLPLKPTNLALAGPAQTQTLVVEKKRAITQA